MNKNQWIYRPKDEEHELLLKFLEENPEYKSMAQVVRESVLRLVHSGEKGRLYSRWTDLVLDLVKVKEEFMELLLRDTGEDGG